MARDIPPTNFKHWLWIIGKSRFGLFSHFSLIL